MEKALAGRVAVPKQRLPRGSLAQGSDGPVLVPAGGKSLIGWGSPEKWEGGMWFWRKCYSGSEGVTVGSSRLCSLRQVPLKGHLSGICLSQ